MGALSFQMEDRGEEEPLMNETAVFWLKKKKSCLEEMLYNKNSQCKASFQVVTQEVAQLPFAHVLQLFSEQLCKF